MMRVFSGFDNLADFVNPVVTMGSYDGVHVGHRALLKRINHLARQRSGESVVITFSPHPRQVLGTTDCGVKLLNSLDEKLFLLESIGVDNVIVVQFSIEFSRISSAEFIKKFLVDKIGVSTLVVGYNHHFGHNREGNFNVLEQAQKNYGFDIYILPKQELDSNKVSSTVIRELIAKGDMNAAAEYLAYPYFLRGNILKSGIIEYTESCKLLPPDGIYNVEILKGNTVFPAELTIESGIVKTDFMNEAECVNVLFK